MRSPAVCKQSDLREADRLEVRRDAQRMEAFQAEQLRQGLLAAADRAQRERRMIAVNRGSAACPPPHDLGVDRGSAA